MFHTRGPILTIFRIFFVVVVSFGDIPKSAALMFKVGKLLTIAKDMKGLRFIVAPKLHIQILLQLL
jgi:hypothetical protein